MKKVLVALIIFLTIPLLTGCIKKDKEVDVESELLNVQLSDEGDFKILKSLVNENITFYSVDVYGIEVQLIIVRASDGTIRTVFNTCQVCNPSPMAYFKQDGDYLVCQNCGNRYHIDKLGLERGGCNPIPITDEERNDNEEYIIIPAKLLEETAPRFENLSLDLN